MAAKNQVTLTLAGDTDQLEKAFDRVGAASKSMSDKVGTASKAVGEHSNALGTLGEKADNSERNLIGIHDVIDGTATIMQGPGKQGLVAYIQGWADLAGGLAPLLISLAQTKISVIGNTIAMAAHATWMGIVKVATVAWTGVQWLLNAALTANPIGLIIVGIAALIAIIVLIATKTTWFQDLWNAAWGWIKKTAVDVFEWFKELPGKLGGWLSGIGDVIKNAFKGAFNWVNDRFNAVISGINAGIRGFNAINPFGDVPQIPMLPKFHAGGVVPGAPGTEMMAVLQAGERVTPAGGSAMVLELRSSGTRVDDLLVEILARAIKGRGGNVQVVLGR